MFLLVQGPSFHSCHFQLPICQFPRILHWWLFHRDRTHLQTLTASLPGGLPFIYSFNCQGDASNLTDFPLSCMMKFTYSFIENSLECIISRQRFPQVLPGGNVSVRAIGAGLLLEVRLWNHLGASARQYLFAALTPRRFCLSNCHWSPSHARRRPLLTCWCWWIALAVAGW